MIRIANAQLWVHDQDEALAFYTKKLGMEVRADVSFPEMGEFRWLTVAPPGQEDVEIVLMPIPGPPVMDTETAAHALLGSFVYHSLVAGRPSRGWSERVVDELWPAFAAPTAK